MHEDQEIGTRLNDRPAVTLRLAREHGRDLIPWASDATDLSRVWAMSEVAVPRIWVESDSAPLRPPDALSEPIAKAKAMWPEWERNRIPVAIVGHDGFIELQAPDGTRSLTYDETRGLEKSSPQTRG